MSEYKKAVPRPTPETQHFWDGCKDGKLILQRCKETGKAYFPPRPFSPFNGSKDVETFEASDAEGVEVELFAEINDSCGRSASAKASTTLSEGAF